MDSSFPWSLPVFHLFSLPSRNTLSPPLKTKCIRSLLTSQPHIYCLLTGQPVAPLNKENLIQFWAEDGALRETWISFRYEGLGLLEDQELHCRDSMSCFWWQWAMVTPVAETAQPAQQGPQLLISVSWPGSESQLRKGLQNQFPLLF